MTDLHTLATIDTHDANGKAIYNKEFFGILNWDGQFWTPVAFDSMHTARRHFDGFWGERASELWPHYKLVPVRVRLDQLPEVSDD